ncbi:MAG: FAD-dependent oxidoreductase [Armatimonadota bacterium]|nr:FAD-dependent oxidoreductase [Armatimonadota bacterium]
MSESDRTYDVAVCGGGPAGIAASVAAARTGAEVILIERYGFLGGMATAGLVNPFMTFFAGSEQIVKGIFQEIIDRLSAKGGWGGPREKWAFDPELLKVTADEICLESGVKLLLHSFVCGADVRRARIASIKVFAKPAPRNIKAKVFVDATGDADLAHLAWVPCEKGRPGDGLTQPMTLNFRVAGVNIERMPPREEINRLYLAARDQGRINCPRDNVLFFFTTREGEVHFNTTRVIKVDGTSARDLTAAEIEGRRQMKQICDFLRTDVPGFEKSYLTAAGTQIGVRETRRIVGQYVLTAEDVLSAAKFHDCVARGSYPIDIHDPDAGGTVIKHLPPGESYDIPYRCLVPLNVSNLLVAGRPISATHEAHSSLRVMPIAFATGQAAGTAAALCARWNISPRDLDVRRLQQELLDQGASLSKSAVALDFKGG